MKKLVFLLLATVTALAASGQVTTSSLTGTVTDQYGVVLPGTTVRAVHTPTGTTYATSALGNGQFFINGMRIGGPYEIEFSFIGFDNEVITGIYLTLGDEPNLNIVMSETSQTMENIVIVGRHNPVINANRTGAQEIITRDMMERLPTLDRSLSDFTKLTPMSSGNNFGGVSYRFNNITVDGASFNNSFGLSSSLGASGIEPISLEAIEQVQVMIAPYDVRNGAFTGAGINSVTKSGTNNWEAAAYFYKKSPSMTGWRQKDDEPNIKEFKTNQWGLSLGGPIIKNKLFFFVNGEIDRLEQPINYRARATKNDPITGNYSKADAETLKELKDFLWEEFKYDPGSYNVSNTDTKAERITARLDWNINTNNALSVKYFYLNSYNTNFPSTSGQPTGGRGPNAESIPYSSTFYRTNNNFNIVIAELNTTINERMSNSLQLGYSALRDYRDMDGGFFPMVDILDGNERSFTTFGTEVNSYGNMLNSDIIQIQDNFTYNFNNHQFTVGTQSDYRKFKNGYSYSFAGYWRYESLDDFYQDVYNYKEWQAAGGVPANRPTSTSIASRFSQKYALDGKFPYAHVEVLTLGLYVQDKWTVHPNFNLTLGLRLDTPIFLTDLERNTKLEGVRFQGGKTIDVSKYPNTKPLFSPRIGWNWDILGDKTVQLRGGSGFFSGTPPYVWLSNQAGNNGLLFGDLTFGRPFDGQALYIPTEEDQAASLMDIAVTDKDFKYPQLWKTNLAVDYSFGDGWILTGEVLYNKDLNAIYHVNIGLNEPVFKLQGTGDNRPYFSKEHGGRLNPYLHPELTTTVIEMRNTSKGYSLYGTLQLQKTFYTGIFKGLYLNGSFSMGTARSVTDGSSSVASSAWKYRPAIDPNAQEVSWAAASFDNRLLLQAAYTYNWSKNGATTVGLVYQRYRPFRFSYTYNGDINGDGQNMNDLIYVPKDIYDIRVVPDGPKDERSAQQIWSEIDAFISQDKYLKNRRGKYAERNGGIVDFANQLDVHISHDIKVHTRKGYTNTLRFSFDIANFLNLLNKDWGVQYTTYYGSFSSPQYQFLKVVEAPSADNGYQPGITMPLKSDGTVLKSTFEDLNGSASRWQMQFGIKYMFR